MSVVTHRGNIVSLNLLDYLTYLTECRVEMSWETKRSSGVANWFIGNLYKIGSSISQGNNTLSLSFFDRTIRLTTMRCFNYIGPGGATWVAPGVGSWVNDHITDVLINHVGPGILPAVFGGPPLAPDDINVFWLVYDPEETALECLRRLCKYAQYYYYYDYTNDWLFWDAMPALTMTNVNQAFVVGDSTEYSAFLPDRFWGITQENSVYPILEISCDFDMYELTNNMRADDTTPAITWNNVPGSEAIFGVRSDNATPSTSHNTGTCVMNAPTANQIIVNGLARTDTPIASVKFTTVGQMYLNPGEPIFVHDKNGLVDKMLTDDPTKIFRTMKTVDTVTEGIWKTSVTAEVPYIMNP